MSEIQGRIKEMERELKLAPGEYRVEIIQLETGTYIAIYEDSAAIICAGDNCTKTEDRVIIQALTELLMGFNHKVIDAYIYHA